MTVDQHAADRTAALRLVAWLAEHDGATLDQAHDAIGSDWRARVYAEAKGWIQRVPHLGRIRPYGYLFVTAAGLNALEAQ
jgi:hypothetical protein